MEEIKAFENDSSEKSFENLVQSFLKSEHYGERWARHWMDLFRYAETHGSEGDSGLPYAYKYRDYLIRAFNADVPYDQLAKEHVAGDLLPNPRINEEEMSNESAYGIGHYRMVEHGYAPIDALEEKVRFTDNQIDVLSKTFLGLTISCARCHDHKFDPISQKDFTAWYGILSSCRPALITVDTKKRANFNREKLQSLKTQIKNLLAEKWASEIDDLVETFPEKEANGKWKSLLGKKGYDPLFELKLWRLQHANNSTNEKKKVAKKQLSEWINSRKKNSQKYPRVWNLKDIASWYKYGSGLTATDAGDFSILPMGESIIKTIRPAGLYTDSISDKHNGVLTSPDFKIDFDDLWIQVAGGHGARIRFVIENYPRAIGLLYKAQNPNSARPKWMRFDMTYFKGDRMHLEVTTSHDIPVEIRGNTRSWFGVTKVIGANRNQKKPTELSITHGDLIKPVNSPDFDEVKNSYKEVLSQAVANFKNDSMNSDQANYLNYFVTNGLLTNSPANDPKLTKALNEFRELENQIPIPIRSPGIFETTGTDQPLFVRGNHLKPAKLVSRSFLEVVDATPIKTEKSGRLELANKIVDSKNPLFARVMVNRIWHHLFGKGLVKTTDNFGQLGTKPTHPELLDFLASRFVQQKYSIKKMIEFIVTSKTFQQSSVESKSAKESDPTNEYLSHYSVRRLEAEAIRDAMLAVSGRMDSKLLGPSTNGNSPRRSIYVQTRRNSPDQFLTTFDKPVPFSTKGNRDITNVPEQSLAMMNSPFVKGLSKQLAELAIAQKESLNDRIALIFQRSLGRMPTAKELESSKLYLAELTSQQNNLANRIDSISKEIASAQESNSKIVEPIRKQILAERGNNSKPASLNPMAIWEFDKDLNDSVGNLHGTAVGNAKVENGGLILNGNSFVKTVNLKKDVLEKTLEVWVSLTTLNQKGGGAISIQTPNGIIFDSIVFAERQQNRWMPGSNNFVRTNDFANAPAETKITLNKPVHLAMVYSKDRMITCYRNGEVYGRPYRANSIQKFSRNDSQIIFGLRHGTSADGNRTLRGKIHKAQFYDRALSQDEVRASGGDKSYVAFAEIQKKMTKEQAARYENNKAKLAELQKQMAEYESVGGFEKNQSWHDFAHAIFNLKEFIYLK